MSLKMKIKIPRGLVGALGRYRSFLIASHVRPDGDSIGSQLALALVLGKLGKRVVIRNPDPVPKSFLFLPGAGRIGAPGPLPFPPEAALILDSPLTDRLGEVKSCLASIPVWINIDHHVSNVNFGDFNWVNLKVSSVGEMVYRLLPELGVKLTRPLALCLYVAVLTDMGRFQFMVTPAAGERVFRLAAELTATGLVPYEIYKRIYNYHSAEELALLSRVLKTLSFADAGRIACLDLKKSLLRRYRLSDAETENFVAYPRDIRGVKVAVLFTEMDGAVKVSLRSKESPRIDVNRVAARFGGGGHPAAAGALVSGTLEPVRARVLRAVKGEIAAARMK